MNQSKPSAIETAHTHPRFPQPTGPRFQVIPVGSRVRPRQGRRRGTVIAVVQPTGASGVPSLVAVRWDSTPKVSRAEATDCLVVLDEPLPFERFTTRQLVALLLNASDFAGSANLELVRKGVRRREGLR
jgi:hypothetical protein